jgi:hypothetical protein
MKVRLCGDDTLWALVGELASEANCQASVVCLVEDAPASSISSWPTLFCSCYFVLFET